MKFILLAAGKGTRLSPITDEHPKCLTPFQGRPIIDYTVDALNSVGIPEMIVVGGYKSDVLTQHLKKLNISSKIYINKDYDQTNMVYSLFSAIHEFTDDLIISYSDIIFTPNVLELLMQSKADFGTIVDTDWQTLWNIRMDDPLDDVESFKLDVDNNIIEIGHKPKSIDEVEGQYIGLSKISKKFLPTLVKKFEELERKRAKSIHFTGFIQHLIEKKYKIQAIKVHGEWIEIDSVMDLKNYHSSSLILKRLRL